VQRCPFYGSENNNNFFRGEKMRRQSILVLVMVVLFVMVADVSAATVFSDDFENDTTGSFPSQWKNYGSNADVIVVDDVIAPGAIYDGNQSVQITFNGGSGGGIKTTFEPVKHGVITFFCRLESASDDLQLMGLHNFSDTELPVSHLITISAQPFNSVWEYSVAGASIGIPVVFGEYARFDFHFDTEFDATTLYINGEITSVVNFPFENPSAGVTTLRSIDDTSSGMAQWYLDNVTVTIETATLLLLKPNGGESLTSGKAYPIKWSSTGSIDNVLIEYSIDNGSNWTSVIPLNTGNNGLYNWRVPAVDSNQCLVNISDACDPNISDTSDSVFTIKPIAARFQGLGFLLVGDYTYSESYGVSSDGSVVVGEGSSASGREAFRWQNGQITGLGDLPNGGYSRARAVSADGSVIVGQSLSPPVAEAILWENSHMTAMGTLPGGSASAAFDVSADGTVVVGRSSVASGTEAFRWQNGQMVGLGDLLGGDFYSTANAVSPDGKVVVGMSHSGSYYEAFRWENGQMIGLGNLYGNLYSEAEDVSANGLVVVGHGRTPLGDEAFRWQNGQMTGLGDLPGHNFYSHAYGVSAEGLIVVGTSHSDLGQGAADAFIWNADDGMMSLKYVLENEYSLDLTGWELWCARAISDDGLNIVGYGTNPSGKIEAWIATFPSIGGLIDLVDLALFIDRWLDNDCSDSNQWCGRADINRNTVVDSTDYSWLAKYWSSIAPAPNAASNPDPNDAATDVGITSDLNWTAGSDAAAHGVYFGTNQIPDVNEFQGYQTSTTFAPGTMATNTTYYWQVNEVGLDDTTTGEVWSFTTMVDPNLVGRWKFDEESGVIAYDSSGKENHGMLVDGLGNGLVWAPAEGALNFDGSNNLSRVVVSTVGMSTTAGTIASWANLAEPQNRGDGRNGRGYFFGCDNGVKDRILLYMDNSNTQLDVRVGDHSENNIITLGTLVWYHIALTWNSGSYVVYLNGSEIAAGTYSGLTSLPSTADIGNNGGSSKQSFHGLMSDVQVYDKSLSTVDIQQLYQDVAN
jgi:probable HAF family extracellular repeat protein